MLRYKHPLTLSPSLWQRCRVCYTTGANLRSPDRLVTISRGGVRPRCVAVALCPRAREGNLMPNAIGKRQDSRLPGCRDRQCERFQSVGGELKIARRFSCARSLCAAGKKLDRGGELVASAESVAALQRIRGWQKVKANAGMSR